MWPIPHNSIPYHLLQDMRFGKVVARSRGGVNSYIPLYLVQNRTVGIQEKLYSVILIARQGNKSYILLYVLQNRRGCKFSRATEVSGSLLEVTMKYECLPAKVMTKLTTE
jgi:hypothetical protein